MLKLKINTKFMITIFAGNTLVQIIIILGICIGVLGGLSDSVKKLRDQEWMCYTGAWTQFFNRLLFVIACVMCLFMDFPGHREHPLERLNWLLFPLMGAVILGLSWCLAFFATLIVKAVFCWVFDSIVEKIGD